MVFAERGETISGGNFHGEYPAKVCPVVIPTLFSAQLHLPKRVLLLLGSGLPMHWGPRAGLHQRAEGGALVQPVPERAACLPGQRGGTQLGFHDRPLHRRSPGFMFTATKQQRRLLHVKPLTLTCRFSTLFSV